MYVDKYFTHLLKILIFSIFQNPFLTAWTRFDFPGFDGSDWCFVQQLHQRGALELHLQRWHRLYAKRARGLVEN